MCLVQYFDSGSLATSTFCICQSEGINTLVIHAHVSMMQVQTWLQDLGVDLAVRQVFLEVHLGVHLFTSRSHTSRVNRLVLHTDSKN